MADDVPPVPSNIIDLSNKHYQNLAINQSDFISDAGMVPGNLSGKLHYGFYDNMIVVQDILAGIER